MNKKQVNALLLQARAEIRAAFYLAIKDARTNVNYKALEAAFQRGDVKGALDALRMDSATFNPYGEALDNGFIRSGTITADGMKGLKTPTGQKASIRFDVRDPFVETLMRDHSSTRIKGIMDDTMAGIRSVLEQGIRAGNGPRTVATLIAGKINPLTGKREGGLIGLTKNQMDNVTRAASELVSGDPKQLANYLGRKMRNKNYDGYVKRAINGEAIPADIRRKMGDAMMNRALQVRAETISRTEALQGLHAGQRAAYDQAIDKNLVATDEIERQWDSSGDGRTRDSHEAMNGQTVGFNEAYVTPDGIQLMYPGDPSAPADEIINCRCNETIRINYLKRIGR